MASMVPRASSRWINRFVLIVIYFTAAAAAFNGFFTKWNFRDSMPRFSIERILDGTAERPFVYRQLLPAVATAVDRVIPDTARRRFIAKMNGPVSFSGRLLSHVDSRVAADPRYMVRYHALYYGAFLCLLASLFSMRKACLSVGIDEASSSLAPVLFVLFFPFLLTGGGYYYDLSEVFFLMTAVALALSRKYWWLVPLTLVATFNKESFLLFVPTLFPLLRLRLSRRLAVAFTTLLLLLAVAVNLFLHFKFQSNPGESIELHLVENLRAYLNPKALFKLEVNYGVFTLRGYNIFTLALVCIVGLRGWDGLPEAIHRHIGMAGLINVPLFFALCMFGELRDLSLMFPGLLLMVGQAISKWLFQTYSWRFFNPVSEPAEKEQEHSIVFS